MWTLTSRRCSLFISMLMMSLACAPAVSRAEGSQPLKVAIVGLEHGHVEGFLSQLPKHADVQLVGIADADTTLWQKYGKKYGLADTLFYKSEANMIERTRPQAVLVYTSIGQHRPAIEIAAQYGVSVMVEKPLTISLDDALAIRRVAQDHKIQVLVNYETTWYSSNRAAYDEVREGRIGDIRRVVVHDGHQGPKEINVRRSFSIGSPIPSRTAPGRCTTSAAMART